MLDCSQIAHLSVVAVLAPLEPRCGCPGCPCCHLKKDGRWTAPACVDTSSMVSNHMSLHYKLWQVLFGTFALQDVWQVLHGLEKSWRTCWLFLQGAATCHAMRWATHGYRVRVHRDALCCLFILTVILCMEVAASCLQPLQLEESVSLVCCEAPAGQQHEACEVKGNCITCRGMLSWPNN